MATRKQVKTKKREKAIKKKANLTRNKTPEEVAKSQGICYIDNDATNLIYNKETWKEDFRKKVREVMDGQTLIADCCLLAATELVNCSKTTDEYMRFTVMLMNMVSVVTDSYFKKHKDKILEGRDKAIKICGYSEDKLYRGFDSG